MSSSDSPHRRHRLVLCALVVASGTLALYRPAGADNGPPPPPPEAYASCQSRAQGDACSVQFGDRTIEGTCMPDPSDGRLFCRPSGPPPRPPSMNVPRSAVRS
jgi:hypothetical protein